MSITNRSALLCAMPAVGHVDPMLVVGRELLRRGWRVRMLTGSRYADRVRAAGVDFVALPAEADTLDSVGAAGRNRGIATINAGVEEAFVRPALPAAHKLDALLADDPVDVVFHDMTFLGVQGLLARPASDRPLVVMCGVGPAGFSSRDCPPYGLGIVPARWRAGGRMRDAVLNRSARWVLSGAHSALDDLLARLDAPALDGAFFMDVLARSDLLAQFTVAEFEYPRSDAPAHLRFYGPMAAPAASSGSAGELIDRLDPDLPVVHVTQGTVANTDFSELIGPSLRALADRRVQVVITAGGRAASDLPPLPRNAFAADYLPYDRLLPRTNVFVTNGGYGGLHQAMRYGVPIVVAGDSEDKVETSARVQFSGAGLSLRTGRPSPSQIARAVDRVLADPRFAAASRRIGERIAMAGGAPALVDDVEAMLWG
ncbi:nucleotide disphospho-sugar-binding domain-containing protein [Microbacterium sp. Clip185]|uniref:nucleotide disphospho-sugar-binding domain-containing protein n=1 Tax=Microbacterium sp. Clip185 TaxID=3025663 RepID=UPI0023653901|nr:nucleotide disphospho-sugar-binding domain-containing protein [Microbacterium sp. Clip185]WDG18749.1 glycosyltransferase [Microbacterium sp. Clip185]